MLLLLLSGRERESERERARERESERARDAPTTTPLLHHDKTLLTIYSVQLARHELAARLLEELHRQRSVSREESAVLKHPLDASNNVQAHSPTPPIFTAPKNSLSMYGRVGMSRGPSGGSTVAVRGGGDWGTARITSCWKVM